MEEMHVRDLIVRLAELVENSGLQRSEADVERISILKATPRYVTDRRLDLWEAAWSWEEMESEASPLLEEIYELGRFNLYAAFQPTETLAAYRRLADKLHKAGLQPPEVEGFRTGDARRQSGLGSLRGLPFIYRE
jgi:hypothetical protein